MPVDVRPDLILEEITFTGGDLNTKKVRKDMNARAPINKIIRRVKLGLVLIIILSRLKSEIFTV